MHSGSEDVGNLAKCRRLTSNVEALVGTEVSSVARRNLVVQWSLLPCVSQYLVESPDGKASGVARVQVHLPGRARLQVLR